MRYIISPEITSILKRFDFLGFSNAQQACEAILTHQDYAQRWDFDGDLDAIAIIDKWKKEQLNQKPKYQLLNEQRTQGKWEEKQARGNNMYEYKVISPNLKTICEMEADSLQDIPTTKANAAFIALAVNEFTNVADALVLIKDVLQSWNKQGMYTNLINHAEIILNRVI